MYTYCLFCETGKCGYVARAVMQKIPCRTLSPKQVQHTWAKGKMVDIEHDLLPGYVFVYTENERLDVALLRPIQGIIRCLSSQDREYELTGSDEQFALMLLHKDGVIGKTKVYEEGQMIRICQGAFEGVETKILKVNRRPEHQNLGGIRNREGRGRKGMNMKKARAVHRMRLIFLPSAAMALRIEKLLSILRDRPFRFGVFKDFGLSGVGSQVIREFGRVPFGHFQVVHAPVAAILRRRAGHGSDPSAVRAGISAG